MPYPDGVDVLGSGGALCARLRDVRAPGSKGPAERATRAVMAAAVAALLAQGTAAAESSPSSGDSECLATVVTTASPGLVAVGDTINVNIRLRFSCPERSRPYHLVVVADGGATGPNGPLVPADGLLDELVVRLAVAAHPHVRAGLSAFAAGSGVWCELSNDPRTVAMCFAAFGRQGGRPTSPSPHPWSLAEAIRSADEQLLNGRVARVGARERDGMLVVTRPPEVACRDGNCDAAAECAAARAAADEAVGHGVELGVVCAGGGCASTCLTGLPIAGAYYPPEDWHAALDRQEVLARSSELRVAQVELSDAAGRGMQPLPATFDPPGGQYDPVSRTVRWSESVLPEGAEASFAYASVATRAGRTDVAVGRGSIMDSLGRSRDFQVPRRQITAALALTRLALPHLLAHEARVHP